ncbi:MAG: hypothetical protein ACR2KZ_02915, partial [Segetibacter sp.]
KTYSMLITLTRTGGIIPITKQAETEVDWTDKEMKELIKLVKDEEGPGQKRDATGYELKYEGETVPINLEKVPPC